METNRLKEWTEKNLKKFDKGAPYFWKLRLSYTAFTELEEIIDSIAKTDTNILYTSYNSIGTLAYVALWYQWRYGPNCRKLPYQIQMEQIWRLSGIDTDTFVYCSETGEHHWVYSAYILGGLAIEHETSRKGDMRFIKSLCRLYYGIESDADSIDDSSRAIAFRNSITRHHSIYQYIRAIVSGELPFAKKDLKKGGPANRLIEEIQKANDEVVRDKYYFEWQFRFKPDEDAIERNLLLRSLPEIYTSEVAKGDDIYKLNQYLKYERVSKWGIPDPERVRQLKVSLQYLQKGNLLYEQSVMTYYPSADGGSGFVAMGMHDKTLLRDVPSQDIDELRLMATDDKGHKEEIQKEKIEPVWQIYQTSYDTWSSRTNRGSASALVFNGDYHLKDTQTTVYRRPLWSKGNKSGTIYNWAYIHDSLTLTDNEGLEKKYYDGQGEISVSLKQHTDMIFYENGGYVKHFDEDNPLGEPVNLLIDKDDLRITCRKDEEEETVSPDKIEFKDGARFREWNDMTRPQPGIIKLRLTTKDKVLPPLETAYLPIELVRDIEKHEIRWINISGMKEVLSDSIEAITDDSIDQPLTPYVALRFGTDEDYVEIKALRPLLYSELIIDDKVAKRDDIPEIMVPWLIHNRASITSLSPNGYYTYDCRMASGFYKTIGSDFKSLSGDSRDGSLAGGTELDPNAPEILSFGLYTAPYEEGKRQRVFWDYENPPTKENEFSLDVKNILSFIPSQKDGGVYPPLWMNDDLWECDRIRNPETRLRCFEAGVENDLYFFSLKPLTLKTENKEEDIYEEIYHSLLRARGGNLSKKDKEGLIRLSEEAQFNWERDYDINIDNENDER